MDNLAEAVYSDPGIEAVEAIGISIAVGGRTGRMTTDVGRVRNGRLDGPWVVRSRGRGQRARVPPGRRRSAALPRGGARCRARHEPPATARRTQSELACGLLRTTVAWAPS